MDHVAIMQKSWGLLPKVLTGEKTIESRWYIPRCAPWGKIHASDIVYFKNGGELVTVRARVAKVLQFSDLTPEKVRRILDKYGTADGLTAEDIPAYAERFKQKRYCILVFLDRVEPVPPFTIDKTGFGAQAAWLTPPDIRAIAIPTPNNPRTV